MAEQQVIEGTWEDVEIHAAEMRGRRVRVTILPDKDEKAATQGAALLQPDIPEAFAGLIGGFHFGNANLSENMAEKFTDLMDEKRIEGRL